MDTNSKSERFSNDDVNTFATELENAGYSGALDLIKDDLIPIALANGISLREAAQKYTNDEGNILERDGLPDFEQDTSWYQLREALLKLPKD